mgnify:CR=1 FL=1
MCGLMCFPFINDDHGVLQTHHGVSEPPVMPSETAVMVMVPEASHATSSITTERHAEASRTVITVRHSHAIASERHAHPITVVGHLHEWKPKHMFKYIINNFIASTDYN